MSREVVIVSAARTAIGNFLGSLSTTPAPKLGAVAIKAAMERANINPSSVEEVIMGNVLSAGAGQAPARQAMIFAGIPENTPAMTINKVCGSGLQSINLARQAIALGERSLLIAGGMENMSLTPHLSYLRNPTKMGNATLEDSMIKDGLWDVYNQFHMGVCAEKCAKEFSFSREEQDTYARQSFERAQNAIKKDLFAEEIAPVEIAQRKGPSIIFKEDEGPAKANFEKMSKLKPVFEKDGTVTAANASTINDAASAVVLMSKEKASELGIKPMARILSQAIHAQAPEWFTTAPVTACQKALKAAGLEVGDIDLFEVNEAFAVVAMAAEKKLGIDREKMNIHGGGISLGHPIGASGTRILTTLLYALKNQNKKRGLATLCIGGGEGIAMIVERIE